MSDHWRMDLAPLCHSDAGALRRLVALMERRHNVFARFVAGVMSTVVSGIADRLDKGELGGRP